jgi:methylated-DNA-protein-cysteine methyltransferase-like protein
MGRHENVSDSLDAICEIVLKIPSGRVMSYGALGQYLTPPLSGFFVGRMMAFGPSRHKSESEVPWWRVLTKNGTLAIAKRDPILGQIQKEKLLEEGVQFDENGNVRSEFFWEPEFNN